jgi:uncharacterized protein (DUF4415 family)
MVKVVRKTAKQARAFRLTPEQKARLDAMTDAEITKAAKRDPDNPPLTAAELARVRRGGRPPKPAEERKQSVTLRLPPQVLSHFRSTGTGWQTRISATLQRYVARVAKPTRRPR